jgi:hypothetical protein
MGGTVSAVAPVGHAGVLVLPVAGLASTGSWRIGSRSRAGQVSIAHRSRQAKYGVVHLIPASATD